MVVILTSGRVGTYGWLHKTPCHSSMKMSCLRRPHPDSRPSASCTIAAGLAPWSPWCEVLPVYVTAISFLLWLHTFPSMIFIHTQESHIPRLKEGFYWKVQHIVNLVDKQHFWKWKYFQFHSSQSITIIQKYPWAYILVVNDTLATEQIKFMGCWNISQHNSHSLFGAGI